MDRRRLSPGAFEPVSTERLPALRRLEHDRGREHPALRVEVEYGNPAGHRPVEEDVVRLIKELLDRVHGETATGLSVLDHDG